MPCFSIISYILVTSQPAHHSKSRITLSIPSKNNLHQAVLYGFVKKGLSVKRPKVRGVAGTPSRAPGHTGSRITLLSLQKATISATQNPTVLILSLQKSLVFRKEAYRNPNI